MVADLVTKLGVSGGVGLLLGLIVNNWIEPTTPEGTGLILVLSIVLTVTLGTIFSKLRVNKAEEPTPDKTQKESLIWTPNKKQ